MSKSIEGVPAIRKFTNMKKKAIEIISLTEEGEATIENIEINIEKKSEFDSIKNLVKIMEKVANSPWLRDSGNFMNNLIHALNDDPFVEIGSCENTGAVGNKENKEIKEDKEIKSFPMDKLPDIIVGTGPFVVPPPTPMVSKDISNNEVETEFESEHEYDHPLKNEEVKVVQDSNSNLARSSDYNDSTNVAHSSDYSDYEDSVCQINGECH
jgi:hypothetical protein